MLGKGVSPVSEIVEDTLWIGGDQAPKHLGFKADLWIHCAAEVPPDRRAAHQVIWLKLDDDNWDWRKHPDEVRVIMETAAKGIHGIDTGKRVLVTCHMGLNRSGLVTGLIMVGLGFEAGEVLNLLRVLRHEDVLCNADFESLVIAAGNSLDRVRRRRAR